MLAQAQLKPGPSSGNHRHRTPRIAVVIIATGAWHSRVGRQQQEGGTGAGILPPTANPHGHSLRDMSRLIAAFTASGNNPIYFPKTPVQILYTDPSLVSSNADDCTTFAPLCGLTVTQNAGTTFSNVFTVKAGTMFYVPVLNADDSPPVVGTFPTTPSQAKHYVFDPAQLGGKDFAVQIDGKTVELGPGYVAGPVTTRPLPDGGGTHFVTIGAFLNPLTPGVHTVRIQGGYFGAAFKTSTGLDFLGENFTYRVRVKP
jgi:hypothetical protein